MHRQRKKKKKPGRRSGQKRLQLSGEQAAEFVATAKQTTEGLCALEGFELVHIECQPEARGTILRVYIDKPGGVTLDDCVWVSRRLGDSLEVLFEDEQAYRLEVSSPGVDRPLAKPLDYERFKGKAVRIKLRKPIGGQENFTGTLSGISGDMVALVVENRTVSLPYEDIMRARLINNNGES